MLFNPSTTSNEIFSEQFQTVRELSISERINSTKNIQIEKLWIRIILKRSDFRILFFGAEKDLLPDIFFDILEPGTIHENAKMKKTPTPK